MLVAFNMIFRESNATVLLAQMATTETKHTENVTLFEIPILHVCLVI